MRKSKINLVISREDYQKYEYYFSWVKKVVFILAGIFFLLFLIFFTIISVKQKKYDDYANQKQSLLESLKLKSGDEAKIYYLQKKYEDLNTFLKEDAFSTPYYKLLTNALKESSQSSNLENFEINKKREVDFTISFEGFSDLMNFFKLTESPDFLKNFEQISLKSFSVIGADINKKENYELSFTGKFISIKGETPKDDQP